MTNPRHPTPPSPIENRVRALEDALRERGHIPDGFVDAAIARAENDLSPKSGAKVVARAWVDPDYRARLLKNGMAACAELGIDMANEKNVVIVENTPEVHNVIVCTQCSCTAWSLLGAPPDWYKSPAYRARVVRESRVLLKEMGLDLPDTTAIRVWDTSGESRFMALPMRPAGTEGWSEEQLASVVTREAMIGVARVKAT